MPLSDTFHCNRCGVELHGGDEGMELILDRHNALVHHVDPILAYLFPGMRAG